MSGELSGLWQKESWGPLVEELPLGERRTADSFRQRIQSKQSDLWGRLLRGSQSSRESGREAVFLKRKRQKRSGDEGTGKG